MACKLLSVLCPDIICIPFIVWQEEQCVCRVLCTSLLTINNKSCMFYVFSEEECICHCALTQLHLTQRFFQSFLVCNTLNISWWRSNFLCGELKPTDSLSHLLPLGDRTPCCKPFNWAKNMTTLFPYHLDWEIPLVHTRSDSYSSAYKCH